MRKLVYIAVVALFFGFTSNFTQAQTPQPVAKETQTVPLLTSNSVAAQYQGGLFGYNKKEKGTLFFDDSNQRLVFRDEAGKERFGLPYKSLNVVYGDSKSVRPAGATVASAIPAPYGANIPFAFIRSKRRFIILEFADPDANVSGTTSFRLENKDLLASAVRTLGEKAELAKRGDAYYRPRD
ncbi:MAG: hypothetical protein H7Z37_00405 [Pyrinomonadaceae bacterium]|nr:hypothetical protein [Pyrinomonadaceae bacterium]